MFIPEMSGGGAERQLAKLANAIAASNVDNLLDLPSGGSGEASTRRQLFKLEIATWSDPLTDRYATHRTIARVGLRSNVGHAGALNGAIANYRRLQAIRSAYKRFQPDLVVSFCDTMNILVLMALGNRVPVIISERSDPRRQRLSKPWEWMRAVAYPRARYCVAQTDEVGDYLRQNYFAKTPERVITIPSAIEAPILRLGELQQNRENQNAKVCLYLGRFSREKRIDRLIKAWAEIHKKFPEWRLRLVGEGREEEALKQLAQEQETGASIDWSGWTTEVWKEWSSADFYILPSEYEGFPQSMLEAMTAGLPGVVTDSSPAIGELFSQGNIGIRLPREASYRELADAIEKLITAPKTRFEQGAEAARVAKSYQWEQVEPRWFDLIRRF